MDVLRLVAVIFWGLRKPGSEVCSMWFYLSYVCKGDSFVGFACSSVLLFDHSWRGVPVVGFRSSDWVV